MLINDLPYRYLNIPDNPLVNGWENSVADIESFFLFLDIEGNNLLKPELKKFFIELGLEPKRGNLWSRKPFDLPWYYHTDQKVNCERFAINWLLRGNPGLTQWSYQSLNLKVEMSGRPGAYGTDTQWWGDSSISPDVSVELNRPMMIVTDIPHRVDNSMSNTWRISYSLRFKGNPTWQEALEKLQNYIVE